MIILNCGGTFNKVYDPIKGELIVSSSNEAIEEILRANFLEIPVRGVVYKDSLEFDDKDREAIVKTIESLEEKRVIIVHGTDTMDRSAAFVSSHISDRCVVFTGAMVPFSIDKAEASANLMLAIAKVKFSYEEGVFIAMHGIVERYDRVYKDRKRGCFCLK